MLRQTKVAWELKQARVCIFMAESTINYIRIWSYCIVLYAYTMYFLWEDQSDAAYCIVHTVLISWITVLYES